MVVHEKVAALSDRFLRKELLYAVKVPPARLYQLHVLNLFLIIPNSSRVISFPPRRQHSLGLCPEVPPTLFFTPRPQSIIFVLAAVFVPAFLFLFTLIVIRLFFADPFRLCVR